LSTDSWAADHGGVAPILLMPDGSFDADSECVDSSRGNAACVVYVPGGDHTFMVWKPAYKKALPWMAVVDESPEMTRRCHQSG
jgi:S-formylglutathione hydrolase FrmB